MIEPVQFVYSNNKLIGSKIISWSCRDHGQLVDETPSHFSILLWDWIIIESTMLYGVRPKLYSTFKDHNKILARFVPKENSHTVFNVAKDMANSARNYKYDFLGAIYVGWCSVRRFYFNKKIPATNKYQNARKVFCNEIYGLMYGGDVSMKHPNWLMKDMMKDDKLIRLE